MCYSPYPLFSEHLQHYRDISDYSSAKLRKLKASIKHDWHQRPLFFKCVRLLSKRNKTSFYGIAEDIFSPCQEEDVGPSKQAVTDYFTDVYSTFEDFTLPDVECKSILHDFDLSPVSVEELTECVASLKLDSATGPGNVSFRQIKRLCAVDPVSLCNYFNSLDFKPAQDFGRSTCTLVYKKGDRSDPANYRPICVTPSLSRLYNKILARRLNKFILENNIIDTTVQKGFLSGFRGCLEHAFYLQTVCKKDAFISLIDLKNAYGSVPQKLLFHVLDKFHLPQKFQNYIKLLYGSLSTRFRTHQGLTVPIKCARGLFQGDPLSPLLFLLCLEPILQNFRRTCPETEDLALADDVSLVSFDDAASHLECLSVFKVTADLAGFTVSDPKTFSFRVENSVFYQLESDDLYSDYLIYLGSCLNNPDAIIKDKFLDYLNKLEVVDYISPHLKCKLIYRYIIPALYYKLQNNILENTTLEQLDNMLSNFLEYLSNSPGTNGRSGSLKRLVAEQFHRRVFATCYKWLQSLRAYFLLKSNLRNIVCRDFPSEFLNVAILSEAFPNPKLFIRNFYYKNERRLSIFEFFCTVY